MPFRQKKDHRYGPKVDTKKGGQNPRGKRISQAPGDEPRIDSVDPATLVEQLNDLQAIANRSAIHGRNVRRRARSPRSSDESSDRERE